MICPSCNGVVGRDCFNMQECAYIARMKLTEQYPWGFASDQPAPLEVFNQADWEERADEIAKCFRKCIVERAMAHSKPLGLSNIDRYCIDHAACELLDFEQVFTHAKELHELMEE